MAVYTLDDERALLAGMAGGDHAAFSVVYNGYKDRVYSFALNYLRSELQAEEVVQEVFMKLWLLGDGLLGVKDLEGYILTICKHKSLNLLRRMKLELVQVSPLEDGLELGEDSTQEEILLNDTRKVLLEGIALLPPQQQLVYRLCHVEGLRQVEVAQQLGLSPETVKRHMKLALKFLRGYLGSRTDITILLILFKLL